MEAGAGRRPWRSTRRHEPRPRHAPLRRGAAAPPGAGPAGQGSAGSGGGAGGGPISLSQATEQQLEELDGIGPTLAERIIQYRDAHGGFKSIDELRQVSGIGDKRFEALRKAVEP